MSAASVAADTARWFLEGEHWTGPGGIPTRLVEHLVITGAAVGLAAALALPIAILTGHYNRFTDLAVNVGNAARAIPTLGLLTLFAVGALGVGNSSAIAALVLFAVPPILTNAVTGMREVDRDVREAARGMGMSGGQVLRQVELPLAVPLIAAGLRTAVVQVIATASLAAYVGSGGLGRYVLDGFGRQDPAQLYAGVVLTAGLAVLAEVVLGAGQRRLDPRHRADRAGGPPVAHDTAPAGPVVAAISAEPEREPTAVR